jgi:hypothetical protein
VVRFRTGIPIAGAAALHVAAITWVCSCCTCLLHWLRVTVTLQQLLNGLFLIDWQHNTCSGNGTVMSAGTQHTLSAHRMLLSVVVLRLTSCTGVASDSEHYQHVQRSGHPRIMLQAQHEQARRCIGLEHDSPAATVSGTARRHPQSVRYCSRPWHQLRAPR